MQFHCHRACDRAQVYLLFYRPAADDPLQNRVVALADGPFCHVEMAFPERYGEHVAAAGACWGSSIYRGETVFYKQKTYQRDGYVAFALEVSTAQALRVRAFCRAQADAGVPFSLGAMYAAYLPVQVVTTEATFCSKHATMALQHALLPEFMHLNPALVTPSGLYRELLRRGNSPVALQVVPARRTAARAAASGRAMLEDLLAKADGGAPPPPRGALILFPPAAAAA